MLGLRLPRPLATGCGGEGKAGAVRAGRDWEKAWAALDRVFSRTGAPFDPLHFYRQVCAVGGFVSRESARAAWGVPRCTSACCRRRMYSVRLIMPREPTTDGGEGEAKPDMIRARTDGLTIFNI